eukprot:319912_1
MKLHFIHGQLLRSCHRFSISPIKLIHHRLFCTTSSLTPLQLFKNKISTNEIQHDNQQLSICKKLDEIYGKLSTYTRPTNINEYDTTIQPLLLTNTTTHFTEMQSNKSTLNIPSSLYMFGEVGTGKTMLMDIFYDCCPEYNHSNFHTRKCRIHFQQFMRYIHLILFDWNHNISVTPDHYKTAAIKLNNENTDGTDKHEVNIRGYRVTKLKNQLNIEENNEETEIYRGPDLLQMIAKSIASEIYLLCFDEIQITDSTNLALLSYLFTYLYQYGVVIVGTSNRDPNDLFYGTKNTHPLLPPFLKTINIFSDVMHLDSENDYRKCYDIQIENELPYFMVI